MKTDVIIIGAGAAGLMAAYTLVKAGKTVTILEARNRLGGRIHTINEKFSSPTELGAEFVHGDLPVTLALLEEAGIGTTDVGFEMWQYHDGKFEQSEAFVDGWDELLEKLNELEHDMPLHDFLEQNFSGKEYAKMRIQLEDFVSGYDTADSHDASAFALRNEWNHEDEDAQHRVNGGYQAMIAYLANICHKAGNDIFLNSVVKEVVWDKGSVKVITTSGEIHKAAKVIVALPLGVLQALPDADGAIVFTPPIPERAVAISNIGFGSVIKILLEFDEVFWETKVEKADLSGMGFLFTSEEIPTYWTQSPAHRPLITGWIGGPPAYKIKDRSDEAILNLTLASLSNVFKISPEILKDKLITSNVANWTAEPYTRGSYAYDKVESPEARHILNEPLLQTIYFTGEYLYDGPAIGTVEAALTSGKGAGEKLKGL
jgi:monoamine oxidase